MLAKWILIAVLAGQPTTQVGTYDSESACRDAIRSIGLTQIYKGAWDNPKVQEAINIWLQYQQEYICVRTK